MAKGLALLFNGILRMFSQWREQNAREHGHAASKRASPAPPRAWAKSALREEAHELGHARKLLAGQKTRSNPERAAIQVENAVRSGHGLALVPWGADARYSIFSSLLMSKEYESHYTIDVFLLIIVIVLCTNCTQSPSPPLGRLSWSLPQDVAALSKTVEDNPEYAYQISELARAANSPGMRPSSRVEAAKRA
ncbi:MAG: hypothetical protein R3C16_09290 [Hyphomonadaceae bacterium]